MAKDGTNRGGRRVRAGDKPAPAAEKKQKGLPVKTMSNDVPTLDTTELEAVDLPEGAVLQGVDMPKPGEYLSARQKNGVPLGADEIYKETWLWLKQRNCENIVNKRLIKAYAQAFARYIQCEEAISNYGLLGKHQRAVLLRHRSCRCRSNFRRAQTLFGMRFTILSRKIAPSLSVMI